jgi:NAD(P)-dependent dehydrogenase (short-subunit alcohol dehydrogenase family)
MTDRPDKVPPQSQSHQPGLESEMHPQPQNEGTAYKAAGKLAGKVAIVTGGDSGIGRAISVLFAMEGADVAFTYLQEHEDAVRTQELIEAQGRKCLKLDGDVGVKTGCEKLVDRVARQFGRIDILVNNAGEQHESKDLTEISEDQLLRTFRTNFFGAFFMTQAALKHLGEGASIINCTSVTAYRGSKHLVDYSATKGALVSFTRSLAGQLADKGIRVNGVAPGPIWTPLIPSSFDAKHVGEFGQNVPLGRPGQPDEVAPCFVLLASTDSSYMTGQVLHPNGGEIVNA